MNTLDGKVAIVTGGNSGIGQACVLALAEAGARIVIDYVTHPEAAEELERRVARLGDQAIGVHADVSKVGDLQRLIGTAVSAFGRLDVMVNNAGIETRSSVLDTTEQQYDAVLAINLKSAFFGTQLAAKQMIAQGGGGRIINISSVHEDWPMPGNTPYCLSKGGMRMLSRTAGVELAPHGVLVVGVGPKCGRATGPDAVRYTSVDLVCRGRWPPLDELTPALMAGLDPALNPDDLLRGRLVSRSDQGGDAGCHGTADLEVTLRDR